MSPEPEEIIEVSSSSSEKSFTVAIDEGVNEATSSREIDSMKKTRVFASSQIESEICWFPYPESCNPTARDLPATCSQDDEEENKSHGKDIREDNDELPDDFLEPLDYPLATALENEDLGDGRNEKTRREMAGRILRQFWRSCSYDNLQTEEPDEFAVAVEHIRVHPKFLHSNATSHKWALGAIAELLDNALDEAVNGATMVNVDMLRNPRNGCPMLMIEDDGGGMDPEQMRNCMSLGYSFKNKIVNTIGQYGNGFKTSTMRLGADVIVFTRTKSKDGSLPTQTIGLLSYTFLTTTGQEDIIVPMIDFEIHRFGLRKLVRGGLDDWNTNLETILQWSPYESEQGLLGQLQHIREHGTIVIVYNLWEDDQGKLELDFDADPHDIQLRDSNRDEKSFMMASKYPNCKHYFTYKYSLRSYVSILYLRLPIKFTILLRGEQVTHHKLVNDLMFIQHVTYRPQRTFEFFQKGAAAVVTLGFVKDAREHIDIQGFNVYHKNRLIKPFWRVWINAGSQGRGIIGVLEVDFIEPAHDKQGFERTVTFARLETRLIEIQKSYWANNCEKIGYVGSVAKKKKPIMEEIFTGTRADSAEDPAPHTVTSRSSCATDASNWLPIQNKAVGLTPSGPLTQESRGPLNQNGTLKTTVMQSRPLLPSANTSSLNLPNVLQSMCSTPSSLKSSKSSARRPAASAPIITHAYTRLLYHNETQKTPVSSLSSSRQSSPQLSSSIAHHVVDQAFSASSMSLERVGMQNAAFSSQSMIQDVSTSNQMCHQGSHNSDSNSFTARAIPADGDSSLSTLTIPDYGQFVSIETTAMLEAKVGAMKQRAKVLEKELNDVLSERDLLRVELEEERKRQALMEGELQRQLQEMLARVNELDSASKLCQPANRTYGLIDKV